MRSILNNGSPIEDMIDFKVSKSDRFSVNTGATRDVSSYKIIFFETSQKYILLVDLNLLLFADWSSSSVSSISGSRDIDGVTYNASAKTLSNPYGAENVQYGFY